MSFFVQKINVLVPHRREIGGIMNFKEFCEKVQKSIKEFYGDDVKVEIKEVDKNNGVKLTGILLSEGDSVVSPAIYLDSYFSDYGCGREIGNIILDIINIYEKIRKNRKVDVDFFTEYEKVKKRICFKLIHYAKNQAMLSEVPHIRFLNLAIVFFYAYESEMLGSGTILIRNVHIESWNVTTDELYKQARENTGRLFPPELLGIEELLEEMLAGRFEDAEEYIREEMKIPMYVLTNNIRQHGAISIFYPGILRKLAKKENANLFILPSSIHEVVILPDTGLEMQSLKEMVQDVNETQVAEEEILSDSVYYYDRTNGQINLLC